MKIILFAFGSFLLVAFYATASMAQNSRTFVSRTGLDSNPCSLTSPCRTFTQAISQTNAGGEVVVLDSAGYGPFTINKAVTVEAPSGVYAGITVTSGDGIDIRSGQGQVILRGLTITNQGGNGNGVVFFAGDTLHIESCVVNGFAGGDGIQILAAGNVFVKDMIARNNDFGMEVQTSNAQNITNVAMDNVHLEGNTSGLSLRSQDGQAFITVAIRNSSTSGNSGGGILVQGDPSSAVSLDIEKCLITNNQSGIQVLGNVDGPAEVSISNCTITSNTQHWFFIAGATIESRGNNTIAGDGANVGALTPLAAQ